jgi:Flp pilus assembly protein TadG
MNPTRSILKRFSTDERGNLAMMFAMALFPMAGAAGVAIDYSRISSGQASLHAALDAATLAVAKDPTVGTSSDPTAIAAVSEKVRAFMHANLNMTLFKGTPTVYVREATEDKIIVEAEGCMPMAFAGFTNIVDPCIRARTAVNRPTSTNLEIALALDNSGSMSGGKMTAAKAAAVEFVNAMFKDAKTADQVKVSLVPFTISVNAGAGMSRTSSNIDRNAASSIHWQNILPTNALPPAGVSSRFSLFDQLGENWQGCFEIRPGAFATNDSPPNDSQPDSLFVPMFAPDEPGEQGGYYVSSGLLNPNGWQSGYYYVSNSYLNDNGSRDIDYNNGTGVESSTDQPACSGTLSQSFGLPFNSSNAPSNWRESNFMYRQTANVCRYNLSGTPGGMSNRKKVGQNTYFSNSPIGPNYSCISTSVQRLTNQKESVITQIDRMVANGATNVLEGFMWAWRTLSPNAPYADGRSYTWSQPNSSKRNRKIIVLMTDGDNSWTGMSQSPHKSAYSPMGYYHNARFGTAPTSKAEADAQLNQKLMEACNNAKAIRGRDNSDAITVYTVAFSTSDSPISATGRQLLEDCASVVNGHRQYYPATSSTQLAEVFKAIASKIGELKLAE